MRNINKFKKWLLFCAIISVAILIYSTIPILNSDMDGAYNSTSHLIACRDYDSCLHEIGHKVDHGAGWISKSDKFRTTVQAYRSIAFEIPELRDPLTIRILFFPGIGKQPLKCNGGVFTSCFWSDGWGGYTELYAEILRESGGDVDNIPVVLQEFYDQERIQRLIGEVNNE